MSSSSFFNLFSHNRYKLDLFTTYVRTTIERKRNAPWYDIRSSDVMGHVAWHLEKKKLYYDTCQWSDLRRSGIFLCQWSWNSSRRLLTSARKQIFQDFLCYAAKFQPWNTANIDPNFTAFWVALPKKYICKEMTGGISYRNNRFLCPFSKPLFGVLIYNFDIICGQSGGTLA